MESVVNTQSFAQYLSVLLKFYDLGLPFLPRWCSHLSPRSPPLQLKFPGITQQISIGRLWKVEGRGWAAYGLQDLRKDLAVSSLAFLIASDTHETALHNIQPGTASRHGKKIPRKTLARLVKGPEPEKIPFDNTHPTLAKCQQKKSLSLTGENLQDVGIGKDF